MAEINLDALKKEIARKKQENNKNGAIPEKDIFLSNLLHSVKTGTETKSTQVIKEVTDIAAVKNKEKPIYNKQSTVSVQNNNTTQERKMPAQQQKEYPDRDELLFEEFSRKRNELIHKGYDPARLPTYENMYGKRKSAPSTVMSQGMINEQALNELVEKKIKENFKDVVEQAINDAIINMYSYEKIEEVLVENKSTVRKIVIDVIKELQRKSKTK